MLVWTALVAGLFIFDLLTPLGYTVPILYVLPLLLTWQMQLPIHPVLAAGGLTVLTWLGFVYGFPGDTTKGFFNRTVVSIVLLICSVGLMRHRYARSLIDAVTQFLLSKEQELSRITRDANIGVWEWNLDNDRVSFSPEWKSQLGYEPNELADRFEEWRSRLHPEDLTPTLAKVRDCVEQRSRSPYEAKFRLRHRDGSWRSILARGKLILGADNRPARLVGIHIDVTALQQFETALQESENLFRTLAQGAPVGIFRTDRTGCCLYVNERWCEITGIAADLAAGEGWAASLHPEDRERVFDEWRQAIAAGKPFVSEYRFLSQDGTVRWVVGQAQPEHNQAGDLIGYIDTITDISARKWVEQALFESEQRFQLVAKATQDTIWDWDLTTNHVWWSPGIETHWGYQRDQVEATVEWWAGRLHPEDRDRIVASVEDVLEGTCTVWSGECRYRRADGTYAFVLDRGYVVRDHNGQALRMIGVEIDMTHAKQAEETRLRQEVTERLLEEREAVARNLHDGVLQSIYAVKLGLERGRRLLRVKPEQLADHLERQIQDAGRAIAELRRFLEGQDPDWAKAPDLREGLEALIVLYRSTSPVEWSLQWTGAEEASEVRPSDTNRHLLYIVREAMSNVVRHASASKACVRVAHSDGCLSLSVEDDGQGFRMGPAKLTGLGLGNMEARARQIGALLHVTARPNAGTHVTIELIRRETHVAT